MVTALSLVDLSLSTWEGEKKGQYYPKYPCPIPDLWAGIVELSLICFGTSTIPCGLPDLMGSQGGQEEPIMEIFLG